MISLKELLGSVDYNSMSKEHQQNVMILLERINKVRSAWAKPMTITSGYRSREDQIRIYKSLAAQRKTQYDESNVPFKSKHLEAAAVDIADPDGKLFQWTKDNEKLLAEIGLWMEEKDDQKRVHFQIVPPKSGKRWFLP